MSGAVRRLNQPVPAHVVLDASGARGERVPRFVSIFARARGEGSARSRTAVEVEEILDVWCVDDQWWTNDPVRRMYYECQLVDGTRRILVYDMVQRSWYAQQ